MIVVIMTVLFVVLNVAISRIILEINTSAMEELAAHDMQSVMNTLEERWEDLEAAADDVRFVDYEQIDEMLSDLAGSADYVNCRLLALTGSDGKVYRSTGVIGLSSDALLYDEVTRHEERFAVRLDYNAGVQAEAYKEYILIGIPIEPFTVEGVTFDHLFALTSINTIENDLVVDSFDGQGIGYIIDRAGYYIVNTSRSHNFTTRNNYYEDIAQADIKGYASPQALIADIERGITPISVEYTFADETFIVILQRMPYSSWYYVLHVPADVFAAQTNRILAIFGAVLVLLVIAILTAVWILLTSQKRKAEMISAHREELAEALAQAQQANRAKTTFLNSMSHDIRTPMNAIIGFTRLARTHIDETPRVAEYLDKIASSSDHLLALINDVLDMSRIEFGKVVIHENDEDLMSILETLRDMVQNDILTKDMQFTMDLQGMRDRYVVCDRMRLNQALLNILSNAIKYTPNGGRITLTVTEKGADGDGYGTYAFRVRDNGIGMSREFLETIYDPFTRADDQIVKETQGTGLGMAITHNIVHMMGGTIEINSAPGEGTEATITLTLRLAPEPEEVPVTAVPEPVDAAGRRILVVEDNELNREIVCELLQEAGFEIESVEDGQAAVDRIQAVPAGYYDVILMDIQMPVMNGYEATRAIRSLDDPDKARIPILALSANSFAEDRQAALDAGMNGHLVKPIEIPALMAALQEVLCADTTRS